MTSDETPTPTSQDSATREKQYQELFVQLKEKVGQLQAECRLHKQVLIYSSGMFNTVMKFFLRAFKEIQSDGYDLYKSIAIQRALSQQHLVKLQSEIDKFKLVEADIKEPLAGTKILQDFQRWLAALQKTQHVVKDEKKDGEYIVRSKSTVKG